MKKIIHILSVFLLGAVVFGGCSTQKAPLGQKADTDKFQIVCTTFPQYDWVMQLLGEAAEQFEVTLLVKNNADIHNYQPSTQDMISMKKADLFIYVGGESDIWVKELMESDSSLKEQSISLTEILKEEDMLVCAEHGPEENEDEEHTHEYDEHIWLSLVNVQVLCQYISESLCEIVPDYQELIEKNTVAYIDELALLHAQYQEVVEESERNPLIFGDRFPFCYLAKDYNLEYYAAYTGCNAEIEVSFDTIIMLSEKLEELQNQYVLVIDGSDKSIAKTMISNSKRSDAEILTMNSIQSVSWEDVQAGASYVEIMKGNLEVLKQALGEKE